MVFRGSLPVFPESQEISNAYVYYGGGAGIEVLYFWTAHPIDEVQEFYETFSLPFDGENRTVFNPSGSPVPVITAEFTDDIIDPVQDRSCYYRMSYTCVMVELFDFDQRTVILRPLPSGGRVVRTPSPIASQLRGGTLIVYTYFVTDLS
jgi:hypothetical protein